MIERNGYKVFNKYKSKTPKQLARQKQYVMGDVVIVGVYSYAFMFNEYVKRVDKYSQSRVFSKESVKEQVSLGKVSRPMATLWNDPYSKYIIFAPMTSVCKDGLNYKFKENSYINPDILIFDKEKGSIHFDGLVKEKISNDHVEKFVNHLKSVRPRTYSYFLEEKIKYSDIASKRKERIYEELIAKVAKEN